MVSDKIREASDEMVMAALKASNDHNRKRLSQGESVRELEDMTDVELAAAKNWARTILREALALLPQSPQEGWRDMGSAPTEIGCPFLICYRAAKGPVVTEAEWFGANNGWWTRFCTFRPGDGDLIGWMPLPPPPSNETPQANTAKSEADVTNQSPQEGMVLVPREPTPAMLKAARDWSCDFYGKPIGHDDASGCYRAMIAASSHSQEQEKGVPSFGSEDPHRESGVSASHPVAMGDK